MSIIFCHQEPLFWWTQHVWVLLFSLQPHGQSRLRIRCCCMTCRNAATCKDWSRLTTSFRDESSANWIKYLSGLQHGSPIWESQCFCLRLSRQRNQDTHRAQKVFIFSPTFLAWTRTPHTNLRNYTYTRAHGRPVNCRRVAFLLVDGRGSGHLGPAVGLKTLSIHVCVCPHFGM